MSTSQSPLPAITQLGFQNREVPSYQEPIVTFYFDTETEWQLWLKNTAEKHAHFISNGKLNLLFMHQLENLLLEESKNIL